jgi:phosphoribosylformimino-5-aminoimidazole carboxamide ribotide isomerase
MIFIKRRLGGRDMLIIPAVDIKDGRCVRLLQGRRDSETVFSDDPSAMAARWEAEGARLLHVVDLDGAFEQGPRNVEAVERIVNKLDIPIELGGGIRTLETISMYLDLGVRRVIVWTETSEREAIEVAKGFEGYGLAAIVFTDIQKDGMESGPSIGQTKALAEAVTTPIIASGGVSSVDDIKALLPLEDLGVEGVIIGRALYSESLNLKQAMEVVGR